jgi:uncharacterized protein (TIGR02453 family)
MGSHRRIADAGSGGEGSFLELADAVEKRYGPLRMFRPQRDTRFAKDKTPYKTAAAAMTETDGGASFYVQLSATGLFVGSGMYHLAPDQLERWRAGVDNAKTGAAIERVVADLRAKKYEISAAETLKTAPRGVAKDHPRIDLLRMKGLVMAKTMPLAKWMQSAKAMERITAVWDDARPLNAWLGKHVGPSTLPPPEPR